jgi:pilus assembly protein CpaC
MKMQTYNKFFLTIKSCLGLFFLLSMVSQEGISSPRTSLTLEVGKGQALQLEQNVSEIFVANPDTADVQLNTPNVAYIFGKKPGSTSVFATDSNGKVAVKMEVKITHSLSELHEAIHSNYPKENVKFSSVPEGIIMRGHVSSPIIAKNIEDIAKKYLGSKDQLINNLTLSNTTQVLLKVKVAEVSRTVLNKLQINWTTAFSGPNNFMSGLLTGRNPFNQTLPSTSFPIFGGNASNPGVFSRDPSGSNPSNSVGIRFSDGTTTVAALIDALDQEGLASILAEPNLVAISGETASFLAGGEFPYPVPQDQNITIEFKQFGISLSFTPTVLSNNSINLRVRPEVSQLDRANGLTFLVNTTSQSTISVPAIKTRRAETSVQLGSGQSLAIAGLIQSDMANTLGGLPGFADIPILGALFRSTQFQKNQSELVIIVTPYVIKPTDNPASLKLPTDTVKFASNLEMLFMQRLNRTKHGNPFSTRFLDAKPVNFVGAAGFNVE